MESDTSPQVVIEQEDDPTLCHDITATTLSSAMIHESHYNHQNNNNNSVVDDLVESDSFIGKRGRS